MFQNRLLAIVFVVAALAMPLEAARAQQAKDSVGQDEFVDLTDEPRPTVPIEQLVVYPEIAKQKQLAGDVVLQVLITKEGNVAKCEVLKSAHEELSAAAIDAVKRSHFIPGKVKDKPVSVWVQETVKFTLNSKVVVPAAATDQSDKWRIADKIGRPIEEIRRWARAIGPILEKQVGDELTIDVANDSAAEADPHVLQTRARVKLSHGSVVEVKETFTYSEPGKFDFDRSQLTKRAPDLNTPTADVTFVVNIEALTIVLSAKAKN